MFLSPLFAAAIAFSNGQPDYWVCGGSVRGLRQSELGVRLELRPSGSVRARQVFWSPRLVRESPRLGGQASSVAGLSEHALLLSIIYRHAISPDQLGLPTDMAVWVNTGPGRAMSPAVKLTLQLDRGRAWTTSFELHRGDSDSDSMSPTALIATNGEREKPMNVDLLTAIEGAHSVDMVLQDAAGTPYATARYHVAADNRQCLTRAAWATAERTARDPTHSGCSLAYTTYIGPDRIPPNAGC